MILIGCVRRRTRRDEPAVLDRQVPRRPTSSESTSISPPRSSRSPLSASLKASSRHRLSRKSRRREAAVSEVI